MWIVLLSLLTVASARGRYEFIDDADLPAFYSLRSAQLAQQAAALQTGPVPAGAVPGSQIYSPYYPYHVYQPTVTEGQGSQSLAAAAPVQYSPYLHYAPQVYRPQSASVVTSSGTQPRLIYSPYYYGHQAVSNSVGQLAKNKKRVA